MRDTRTGGFTLVEVIVSVTLVALIAVNISMLIGSGKKNFENTTAQMELEVQAARAMDRIALALMGSSRDTLYLTPEAPFNTHVMNYEMNLGMDGDDPVWSDPERIELVIEDGKVQWLENPGDLGERHVVWAKWVTEYLEGEVPNNLDDNGNGLVDEKGLSFDLDRNSVIIRLTAEREGPNGEAITKTMTRRVTCRN